MNTKSVHSFMLIAGLLVAALLVFTCSESSTEEGDCENPDLYKCNDNQCHSCCSHEQCKGKVENCPDEEVECEGFECICLCVKENMDCSNDINSCCQDLACDVFTNLCVTACKSDADCQLRQIAFSADLKCGNGRCDFEHCLKDGQCPPGKVCFNGGCVTKPSCDDLKSCEVLPSSVVTRQGFHAQLTASAYLQSGALAPGMVFGWESDKPAVASVDPSTGLVTGGTESDFAQLTATVKDCQVSCDATVINYGTVLAGKTRVLVVEELAGTPVQGATVVVGTEVPVTTNQQGWAEVNTELSPATPQDIAVSKLDFNYVTLRAVESNDVVVHLGKIHHVDLTQTPPRGQAGGIQGEFDFGMIACEPGQGCEVRFGFAGLSIPGNLINLNLDLLIGGMIKTKIELGSYKLDEPLPAGLTACLENTCYKESYYATGFPGNRVAWGLGGKADVLTVMSVLGPLLGNQTVDVGDLVAKLVPLFSNVYTAVVPNVKIETQEHVRDFSDLNDNDKNEVGDYLHCACQPGCEVTTHYCDPFDLSCQPLLSADASPCPDTIPDYQSFMNQDMTLKVRTDQQMSFVPPTLPQLDNGYAYDSVLLLAGVLVRGAGLVPLGIVAGLDSKDVDDPPDGQIEGPLILSVADVAGRIPENQIQRVVVALALNLTSLGSEVEQPAKVAGQVKFVDSFEGEHVLDDFLVPAQGSYLNRQVEITSIPNGVTFCQVIATGEHDLKWHVLGPWVSGIFELPDAPATGDRSEQAAFACVKLKDNLTYQQLIGFNSTNLGDLANLTEAFVFAELAGPIL